jgi:arylsulfatase A
MILTHEPYDATPDSSDWAEAKPPGKGKSKDWEKNQRHFADMTAYMDKMIGRLVAKLDALGIRDNTLILFTGDNGTGQGIQSKVGDRMVAGGKGKSIDAGMRVPLIVNWPAGAARGKVVRDLVDMTDFLPTICEAAGIEVPAKLAIDGHSFLPQVRGETGRPRPWIYSWFARNGGAKATTELARNHEYGLHRDGKMFDVRGGDDHTLPLDLSALSPEAEQARRVLQSALDLYANARPANLASQAGKSAGGE